MLKYRRIIQDSARRIAEAANRTVGECIVASMENEAEITGEMLGGMKAAMHGYKSRGVRWTAKTIASQGAKAQEKTFDADFMGVLEFDLPEYSVKKGFLAQARRVERGQVIAASEWERLEQQCQQMLSVTAESFVFVYARSGIMVVPALAIASATARINPHDFYSRTALRFYEDHFECFIGDLGISSADTATLERLKVRHALYLGASHIPQVGDQKAQQATLF